MNWDTDLLVNIFTGTKRRLYGITLLLSGVVYGALAWMLVDPVGWMGSNLWLKGLVAYIGVYLASFAQTVAAATVVSSAWRQKWFTDTDADAEGNTAKYNSSKLTISLLLVLLVNASLVFASRSYASDIYFDKKKAAIESAKETE